MIIALDFDGVIHDFKHPVKRMGPPISGAREALDELAGNEIIVFTQRRDLQVVREWLDYFDFNLEVTNMKPNADVFVDDKAIRFKSWSQTLGELRNLPAA